MPMKLPRAALVAALALVVVWQSGAEPGAASTGVVISQVYGGGGNAGATLKNDFIELFNRGTVSVSLSGTSVQYGASGGTTWAVTALTNVTLQPGQYYLVQEAVGATGTVSLPPPDATGTIAMSATAGKVAFVSSTTALSGACPTTGVVDLVGYGAANCSEAAPTPALTNTTAAIRSGVGCAETDSNSADFSTGAPNPRNTASAFAPCSVPTNPFGTAAANPNPVRSGSDTVISATVTGGSNPSSSGLAVSCNLSAIGGSPTFTLPLSSGSVYAATYTVPAGTTAQPYVIPCGVTDAQSRSGSFNLTLTVTDPPPPLVCDPPIRTSTAIHAVQGSGATSQMAGQVVELEGIVVGDFRSATQLNGFYLQEPDDAWDTDPATSEGIFVFDGGAGLDVNVGDRVRVKGTVNEFSGTGSFLGSNRTSTLTELGSIQDKLVCSAGNGVTYTSVTLPTATPTELEQYEGMAVSLAQRLTVTGNFSLGTFGQVDLAPAVLFTPTTSADRSTWAAQADLIPRSVIALDDASSLANANLFPTLFPQGGLSAANTLRVGALVNYDPNANTNTPLVGILDDRFGAYRIEPTAPVSFYTANPRPAIAPILAGVGGRFRAISANVLNFFTTFNPPGRGAANQTELDHQKTKIVEELFSMNGDVVGLSEVQNFTSGGTSGATYTNTALQSLVDGLNCRYAGQAATCASAPPQPYAFVDTLALGAANGTDAIRSAIVYRADRLQPVGGPASYYQNDTNRPSLAQTFQPASGLKPAQQTFTFVVNHFRSKGSACGGGLDDPLQGNCNGLRLLMAQNVVNWLNANPTADSAVNRRIILVGDFNAYFGEDPIQHMIGQGYRNLIDRILGAAAYSYDFGSQRGYLDHVLANGAMNLLVRSVAEWHNNSDEPSSLEALNSSAKSAAAQAAYYGADPFAASDHDPIVIGFNTLVGDLNDDGVVDAVDQRLVTGAVGRSAATVDRRMDYDEDGRITLNDYRLWTAYYRAFVQ
jgi:predicted extracellular nuclease